MEREPIRSRSLVSVGYDPDTKELDVEFRSGAVYRYENVPAAFHVALLEGKSPGRFFAYHIRDAFPWTALEPPRPAGPAYFG